MCGFASGWRTGSGPGHGISRQARLDEKAGWDEEAQTALPGSIATMSYEVGEYVPPPGACDCHAHVISDDRGEFPFVSTRSYTPHPAPERAYLEMLHTTGMDRGVLVQISVYGTDNRYLVRVLRRHPHNLRGVAVVGVDVTDQALQDLDQAGVRGLRINTLFGGGVSVDAMETLARRVAPFGWHLQLLVDGLQLPELLPRIGRLPVPVVIDHLGHMPAVLGIRHRGFVALLDLLRSGRVWVKLSGVYRIDDQPPAYPAAQLFAQEVLTAAPDRVLYGSDWPHTAVPGIHDAGHLRNLLGRWIPDARLRQKVLVDNPAALYGFR